MSWRASRCCAAHASIRPLQCRQPVVVYTSYYSRVLIWTCLIRPLSFRATFIVRNSCVYRENLYSASAAGVLIRVLALLRS